MDVFGGPPCFDRARWMVLEVPKLGRDGVGAEPPAAGLLGRDGFHALLDRRFAAFYHCLGLPDGGPKGLLSGHGWVLLGGGADGNGWILIGLARRSWSVVIRLKRDERGVAITVWMGLGERRSPSLLARSGFGGASWTH
ncbi:hypothetical protein ACLOJK_018589 [Asimina triloba]